MVLSDGVVASNVLTIPGFLGCPVSSGSCPERIIGRQAEGEKGGSAEVETSCVDVVLRHANLTTRVTNAKPAVCIEGSRLGELTLNDGRQSTTYLSRTDVCWQNVQQGSICQSMERAEAIDDGATSDRIAAFWRNHALQLFGQTSMPLRLCGQEIGTVRASSAPARSR